MDGRGLRRWEETTTNNLTRTETHPSTADQQEHKQPCHSNLPAEWRDSSRLSDDTVRFLYDDKRDWTAKILHGGNWKKPSGALTVYYCQVSLQPDLFFCCNVNIFACIRLFYGRRLSPWKQLVSGRRWTKMQKWPYYEIIFGNFSDKFFQFFSWQAHRYRFTEHFCPELKYLFHVKHFSWHFTVLFDSKHGCLLRILKGVGCIIKEKIYIFIYMSNLISS